MDRNHIFSFFSDHVRALSTRKRHDELHQPLSEKKFLDRSDHTLPTPLGSERSVGDITLCDAHYITALPDLSLPPKANRFYSSQDIQSRPDTAIDKPRTILRRAVTLRQKSSWSIVRSEQTESKEAVTEEAVTEEAVTDEAVTDEAVTEISITDISGASEKTTSCLSVTDWIKRAASSTFGRKGRKSVATTSLFHEPCGDVSAIPQMPSRPSIHRSSGAAARAAAAAQNELLGPRRSLRAASKDPRLVKPKLTRDSESGIGIELRDREDDTTATDVPISRLDPTIMLPEEVMSQVFAYLDAISLMSAELVSHRWQSSASSHHVWKDVFRNAFQSSTQGAGKSLAQYQNLTPGLGRSLPDQNWKKMWKTRKVLHQRWLDGYAAAIYLEGHSDSVYCVQFDESKIITGSRDRTIRIWDAHTYKCTKILGVAKKGGEAAVPLPLSLAVKSPSTFSTPFTHLICPEEPNSSDATAISPMYHIGSILCLQYDHELMVTGSSDNTCIMWDIKAGWSPIRRLRHHTAGVLDVCFDDKHIVSCSKDTAICLWDRRTGDFIRSLSGHRGPVNAVQLRGDLVVSASGDGVAKLWNLTSGMCIKEFPSKDRGMACVEFSPDSRTILAGGNDQVIYQFDANTGELVRELRGHTGLVRSLHLDSANGRIVSGSYDASVRAYDLRTGHKIVHFPAWTTSWMLSAKADYRRIVATSQDSRVVIMDFGYQLPNVEMLEA